MVAHRESGRQKAVDLFRKTFGSEPSVIVEAPGRINIIGEHTDYNDGFVLPIAIDRWLFVAAKGASTDRVHIYAADFDEADLFSIREIVRKEEGDWRNYARGVAAQLKEEGVELKGLQALIVSQIAIGAGLSSSAALEAALALAFLEVSDRSLDPLRLALLCQRAEHQFAGVHCGIMDQMATLLSLTGHALLIDCQSLTTQQVPLPDQVTFLVADTGKPRALAASEYNIRRSQCQEAVQHLSQLLGKPLRSLRYVSLEDINRHFFDLPDPVGRRARHVVTENQRVLDFVSALKANDLKLAGSLLLQSHQSLRDDYEVSCPELDAMVEAIMSCDGAYGARLTGAGFGGACITMVDATKAPTVQEESLTRYRNRLRSSPYQPHTFLVRPVGGASVVRLSET
ncbi:MAG: galactokinase [Armatimonadetes bacterium]|nr:galactokinase [Armatimonadota bacterium]MDW8121405.1 galactokinase [Armatimonadota bacterium]